MTPAEELKAAVREGRMAFSDWKEEDGQPRPVVEARLIRKLVLGHTARSGVRIRGAEIRGELNLVDARADNGDACNALILEECVLTGEGRQFTTKPAIDARHAHLQRLSLTDCEVDGIELSSAVLENDLTLDGIRGRPNRHEAHEDIIEWMHVLERARGTERYYFGHVEALLLAEYRTSPGAARHAEVKLDANGEGRVYSRAIPEDVERSLVEHAREVYTAVFAQLAETSAEREFPIPADDDLQLDWARVPESQIVRTDVTPEDFGRVVAQTTRECWFDMCWIKARGVRVGGSVIVRRATLRLPWRPGVEWPPPEAHECWRDLRAPFALDLQGAQVGGSVFLQPGFVAIGGVNLGTATIGGDLWAQGARLVAAGVGQGSVEALRARSVDIRGRVEMTRESREDDGEGSYDEDEGSFKAYGRLDLSSGKIGGALRIEGAATAPVRVEAAGADVAGDLTIFGSVSGADFSGSVTHGDLCLGTSEHELGLVSTHPVEPPSVKLVGASVARAVRLGKRVTVPAFPIDLKRTEHSVRTTALRSHPMWRLAEARFEPVPKEPVDPHASTDASEMPTDSEVAIVAFLYRPDGKGGIVLLDGRVDPIHSLNTVEPPALHSEEHVRQYVSFFCNYLWADEGAFVVTVRPDDGTSQVDPIRHVEPSMGHWRMVADIDFGNERSESNVLWVSHSGHVFMEEDDKNPRRIERRALRYDSPFRWLDWKSSQRPGPWPPEPAHFEFTDDAPGLRWDAVIAALRGNLDEHRPLIDLSGLKAGSLDDAEGAHWAPLGERGAWGAARRLRLALSGFEYDRIDGPQPPANEFKPTPRLTRSETIAWRRSWLELQYTSYPPTERDYRPQPYEQLARTWRAAGHLKSADDITLDKLHLEKVKLAFEGSSEVVGVRSTAWDRIRRSRAWNRVSRLWHWMKQKAAFVAIQLPFGFGLKPWRALGTVIVVYLIGLVAVFSIPLKVDAAAVSTVVITDRQGQRVVIDEAGEVGAPEEIDCGDLANVFVYPLDVMIPLLDLRQEARCQFSITNQWLGVAKGAYAILGWLVITGAIITWSGVVRRHTER
jgi:hypothetical protein